MTAIQHVYLTAHGNYHTGPWVGEAAQFGVRLSVHSGSNMPDKGSQFTVPEWGDVETDQGTEAGANGILTRTWTARRGPVGSLENFDAGFQIDCAEDVRTFLNTIRSYQSTAFRWTHVKLAPVGANGKTLASSSVYTFGTALPGTVNSLLPPQVALAVSTRANIIGRRGRGRVYLPALSNSVLSSDGTTAPAAVNAIRGAFVDLVNNLQNLPGVPDYLPLVTTMSAGETIGVRPSEVRTGNRLDTIRSRREQVAEVYTPTQL